MNSSSYDPFSHGPYPVGVRPIQAQDRARDRTFPCEIWYPALGEQTDMGEIRDAAPLPGDHPLVVFSHGSGGNRRSSTFLCTHLAGHGYVVAAMDHLEVVAGLLAPPPGETAAERAARIDAIIAGRVPDVRFLLDHLLTSGPVGMGIDAERVGLAGYSFGGWTVLAATEVEPRVRSVVAMGPGGSRHPRPGVLPLTLAFARGREVPTLYLAAENDVPIPLEGVVELYERTPDPKRMFVLRRADHQHFLDDVEGEHEVLRGLDLGGDATWIPGAMRPIAELSSGEQAHLFAQGLALAHLDATLRRNDEAERFLAGDVEGELAARGAEGFAYPSAGSA